MAVTLGEFHLNRVNVSNLKFAVDQVYSEIPVVANGWYAESVGEEDLWRELSCCILSSQVNYELARAAADAIDKAGVFCSNAQSWESVAQDIHSILSGTLNVAGRTWRYRFPSTKSYQIARTWAAIRGEAQSLTNLLAKIDDVAAVREWMVLHAPGLGPKQSSMFLRNAGVTIDLAVLDRHVLRYMEVIELVQNGDRQPAKLRDYQATELILRSHADELGYRVGLLDWAIWIVMKVARSKGLAMGSAV